jgi:hypothetical protein
VVVVVIIGIESDDAEGIGRDDVQTIEVDDDDEEAEEEEVTDDED